MTPARIGSESASRGWRSYFRLKPKGISITNVLDDSSPLHRSVRQFYDLYGGPIAWHRGPTRHVSGGLCGLRVNLIW